MISKEKIHDIIDEVIDSAQEILPAVSIMTGMALGICGMFLLSSYVYTGHAFKEQQPVQAISAYHNATSINTDESTVDDDTHIAVTDVK